MLEFRTEGQLERAGQQYDLILQKETEETQILFRWCERERKTAIAAARSDGRRGGAKARLIDAIEPVALGGAIAGHLER